MPQNRRLQLALPQRLRAPLRPPRSLRLPLLIGLVLCASLSACAQSDSGRLDDASAARASAQRVFATDEDAAAAAEAAYRAYALADNQLAQAGWVNVGLVAEHTTPQHFEGLVDAYAELRELGLRQQGFHRLAGFTLQQYYESEPGVAVVVAYACVDLRETRAFTTDGTAVTPPYASAFAVLEVMLVSAPGTSRTLLLDESTLSSRGATCG